MNWLKNNRRNLDLELLNSPWRRFISPAYYSQYKITLPLVTQNARGRFIDLGCGDMPYRRTIEPIVDVYHSLDYIPRASNVDFIGDIQSMTQIPDNTYDSAMCLEVLEHIPQPQQALNEAFRILKPGGTLVLSVPHLSRLHELPNDYFRFTRYGLNYLLKKSGFSVQAIYERGGLLSFLGHQVALIMFLIIWGIPGIKHVAFILNALINTIPVFYLDRWLKSDRLFPMGYTVVASKESENPRKA